MTFDIAGSFRNDVESRTFADAFGNTKCLIGSTSLNQPGSKQQGQDHQYDKTVKEYLRELQRSEYKATAEAKQQ